MSWNSGCSLFSGEVTKPCKWPGKVEDAITIAFPQSCVPLGMRFQLVDDDINIIHFANLFGHDNYCDVYILF